MLKVITLDEATASTFRVRMLLTALGRPLILTEQNLLTIYKIIDTGFGVLCDRRSPCRSGAEASQPPSRGPSVTAEIVGLQAARQRCCHVTSDCPAQVWNVLSRYAGKAAMTCYKSLVCAISYCRHCFPANIIQNAVRLYFRFPLGLRNVEDLLAECGIDISYETVRRWAPKFGRDNVRKPRRSRFRPDGCCHLDEMFVSINGKRTYLWRAMDTEGEVLDIRVQSRRNKKAALKFLRTLLKKPGLCARRDGD